MNQEPRKISDVVLSLEKDISSILKIVQSYDVLLKVISNKLNDLTQIVNNLNEIVKNNNISIPNSPKISIEAVNTQALPTSVVSNIDMKKNVLISAEDTIPVENYPKGFRRTSRPETFSGDNAFLEKAPPMKDVEVKFPTQIPRPHGGSEVISKPVETIEVQPNNQAKNTTNSVPVKQRIVDGNGKSVFLADVEIINNDSNESVSKIRTNGTGNWMASLPLGNYRIIIKKRDKLTTEAKEVIQNIQIDGLVNPLRLDVLIIK